MAWRRLVSGLERALEGSGFDRRFVSNSAIDTGPHAARAREIAGRLNAHRTGISKEPVLLWKPSALAAVTARGRWIYVALSFAQRLSDDGLAFVLAHEMAHHDLGHLSPFTAVYARVVLGPEAEAQADRAALVLSHKAGFDPRGGIEALTLLGADDEAEPTGWFARWRATHPPTPARIAAIEAWVARTERPAGP